MAIVLPSSEEEKAAMIDWALQRLPAVEDFGPAYPIAVLREGAPAAVVVYHQWRGPGIEMSIASDSPRWATRQTVSLLLAWAFQMYGVKRITAIVERRNKRSRKLAEGLGFKLEGTMLDAFETDDGIIYGMTRRYFERSKWNVALPPPSVEI